MTRVKRYEIKHMFENLYHNMLHCYSIRRISIDALWHCSIFNIDNLYIFAEMREDMKMGYSRRIIHN